MRSTLLCHSEWAQWAASGLERRPCQNGAGATPQRDHTGDHHKGNSVLQCQLRKPTYEFKTHKLI